MDNFEDNCDTNSIIHSARKKRPTRSVSLTGVDKVHKRVQSRREQRKLLQIQRKRNSQRIIDNAVNERKTHCIDKEMLVNLPLVKSANKLSTKSKREQILKFQKANIPIPPRLQMEYFKMKNRENKVKNSVEGILISDDADGKSLVSSCSSVPLSPSKAPESLKSSTVMESLKSIKESNTSSAVTLNDIDDVSVTSPMIKISAETIPDVKKVSKSVTLYKHVLVRRKMKIDSERSKLPIICVEQEIVECVLENDVVIVSGNTGCGKSTQVPQFLYEHGLSVKSEYGSRHMMIGITQPRRVAAVSIAKRIADELNDEAVVGYQVRYDKSNVSERCRIKIMTDGILMREMQNDTLARRYSVIVIDEAHERSANCDILIGFLSRLVKYRRRIYDSGDTRLPPLKLVIMSATLRVADFTSNNTLFSTPPPVIKVDSKSSPVTIHFNRVTPDNYLSAATDKVLQIHRQLPRGNILVFVTGKNEVKRICNSLRNATRGFTESRTNSVDVNNETAKLVIVDNDTLETEDDEIDADDESDRGHNSDRDDRDGDRDHNDESGLDVSLYDMSDEDFNYRIDAGGEEESDTEVVDMNKTNDTCDTSEKIKNSLKDRGIVGDNIEQASRHKPKETSTRNTVGRATIGDNSLEENTEIRRGLGLRVSGCENIITKQNESLANHISDYNLKVLPMYASLSQQDQLRVFEPCVSRRLVIVATNVAETSITLPNIRYVVDTGKEKKRHYVSNSGVSYFSVQWVSKASADQRSGRAGRVCPGHCYRLYSSALYHHHFKPHLPPSLLSVSLDSVVLYLTSIGICNPESFPFPVPPSKVAIDTACQRLQYIQALTADTRVSKQFMKTISDRSNRSESIRRLIVTADKDTAAPSPNMCTSLGLRLSKLAIGPRYGRILLHAYDRCKAVAGSHILDYACLLVACLSIGTNIMETTPSFNTDVSDSSPFWHSSDNDMEAYVTISCEFLNFKDKNGFCNSNGINLKAMTEVVLLAAQLMKMVSSENVSQFEADAFPISSILLKTADRIPLPSQSEKRFLYKSVILGSMFHIAVRCASLDDGENDKNVSQFAYKCGELGHESLAFMNSRSTVYRRRPIPTLLVYNTIVSTFGKYTLQDLLPVGPRLLLAVGQDSPLIVYPCVLKTPPPVPVDGGKMYIGMCRPKLLPLNYQLPLVEVKTDQPKRHQGNAKRSQAIKPSK